MRLGQGTSHAQPRIAHSAPPLCRYGDALQWAAHYGISADPVRIAQWRDADVSRHSIRDFLHKVSSLQWVLGECCRRLPDDDASMEILLEYALERIAAARAARGAGTLQQEDAEGEGVTAAEDDVTVAELDNYEGRCRRYLTRLATMVALIDADEEARAGGFDAAAYHSFREAELLRVAVEMAAGDRFDALKVLFEKEEDELRAQRLHVLGAVSETTPPREYGELLQELVDEAIGEEDEDESEEEESEEEEEEEGEEEDGEVKAAAAARRAERAAARETRAVARAAERQVARAELVGWVSRRAREIDARPGQLGHAQELL